MNKIVSIGIATAVSLLAIGGHAQAATKTWANNGTFWTDPNNWVGGVAIVNSYSTDFALFTDVSTAQPYINTTGRAVNGIDVQIATGGFDMTSAAGADIGVGTGGIDATTQLSGTNTIRTDIFKFGNGSSYSTSSIFAQTTSTATDSTFTFSSPSIQLNNSSGTIEIQSRRAAGSGFGKGIINISGVISGNNTSSLGLLFNGATASNGAGTFNKDYNFVNLTGNNSFNSKIALNGITLNANSLANANSNSALGASGDIVLGGIGGTFANSSKQNSSLVFNNLSSNVSTDRLLFVSGGTSVDVTHSLVNNDSSYTVSFNNTGSAIDSTSTTGSRTIQFGGTNTGDNTFAEVIGDPTGGGKGGVSKVDTGKWVLTGNNTYTGVTTINGGTLRIGHANALGTSGNITFGGGTLQYGSGITTDLSSRIKDSGSAIVVDTNGESVTWASALAGTNTGGLTKNGNGTLELNAANTFTGTTVVNSGTLKANAANSLGSTSNITVTGGSFLVTASNAIGDSTEVNLAGGTMNFSGNVTDSIGKLTLSADSIIDLGTGNVSAAFADLAMGLYNLSIYNWTGTTLWNGGDGNNTDKVYFNRSLSANELERISFYSDFGSSFVGTGFQLMDGSYQYEVIPVPEPETWVAAVLILAGTGAAYIRKKRPTPAAR